MQCYSEILPPTGVTHSLFLPFISASASNLIIARTSLLQIYSYAVDGQTEQSCLSLVAEYALQGTISGLAHVKTIKSQSGGDAILLAFRDAKLSLIEWDASQHSISTISIHFYENHDLSLCPWSPSPKDCVTHLTVDPSSRCATFNFNVSSLAVIPFHQAGDDLAMDDDDEELSISDEEDEELKRAKTKQSNSDTTDYNTLYAPSFVLPLTTLDPGLLHPIAMSFLHEYREPTIGILYSTHAASMNLALERKDMLCFSVYTLDLEQKASTTLLAITKLPNDLEQIAALPAPIGGTLLIGGNEIVHIDQGGKTNAIAVNEFSKQSSSFPMADQSSQQLRLEGCQVLKLPGSTNDVLLLLADGQMAVLSFRTDGRSVSGISLRSIAKSLTADVIRGSSSTVVALTTDTVFIGSEENDSVVIGISRKSLSLKRQLSRSQPNGINDGIDSDGMEDDDDDDDLYAESKADTASQQASFDATSIVVHHKLPCFAPITDMTVGRRAKRKRELEDANISSIDDLSSNLDLVLACNRGKGGSLAFLTRTLDYDIIRTELSTQAGMLWALSSEPSELDSQARPFDDLLIQTRFSDSQYESTLSSISATHIQERPDNEFEKADQIITACKISADAHVVVYRRDIRVYNRSFGLDQIFTIVEEEAEATAQVVSATVAGGCIQVVKSDRTLSIYRMDNAGDLDEIELPSNVASTNVLSACLCSDAQDFFDTKRFGKQSASVPVLLTTLTEDGELSIHTMSDLTIEVFRITGLDFLPRQLSASLPIPKHWRNKEAIGEMSLSMLGTATEQKPYLTLRTDTSDIVLYEPFSVPDIVGAYRFTKIFHRDGHPQESNQNASQNETESINSARLIPLHDVSGMGVVFVTGRYPCIILKAQSNLPRIYPLALGPVRHVSQFHDSSCNRGFALIDDNHNISFCELPKDIVLGFPDWVINRLDLDQQIDHVVYYPRTNSYVLATSYATTFHLPRDDEWHPEWEAEYEDATTEFLPTTSRSCLKLLSSMSHSVISQYQFDPDEHIMSLKCLNLEVNEHTHERKDLIVVGTAISKGENVVTRGTLYLFDIADVVPQLDIPETDLKLRLVSKEDVKGAVSAISAIGSQGFLLNSQGQKCMVRGLREDNAILPVAFMDMRYHVSVAQELPGTGLTILGDVFSGLWLTGYAEDPYKMQLLSRDLENPSVLAAEFLPHEKQLHIVSSDSTGDLRILQYDPENPRTERGSVLLQRSTFYTGYLPKLMKLLPRVPTPREVANSVTDRDESDDGMQVDEVMSFPQSHIMMTTREGALALITPLPEQSYRRLSTLQALMMNQLDQHCALNPRAHRQVETDGIGGRGMIDGQVLRRWLLQSTQHKHNLADRAGGQVWEISSDIEAVSGAGLGFA